VSIRPPTHNPQATIANVFAITSPEAKPVQVRVASAAPSSSGIGAFFGNLFGSKRDNANPNMRESSVTQSVQPKSQAPAARPSAVPAQTKATAAAKETPEVPRTTNAEPPPDAGGTRTTNLLVGAVPGASRSFRKSVRCVALSQGGQRALGQLFLRPQPK
jgi:hypothetical protein